MSLLLRVPGGRSLCLDPNTDIHKYVMEKLKIKDYWISSLSLNTFELRLRIIGGKGGFGSQLRSQGSKMSSLKRAGNYEECRDLTGRRVRHVKEEKIIQEYLKREPELIRKQQEERTKYLETKLERLQRQSKNKNSLRQDVEFTRKRHENINNVELAVQEALVTKSIMPLHETRRNINRPSTLSLSLKNDNDKSHDNDSSNSSKDKSNSNSNSKLLSATHIKDVMNEIESSIV